MDVLPPELFISVVAVVSALAGGLLTWIVGYISGERKSKRQHRRLPAATAQGEAEPPAPTGEQELLHVSRTKRGGLAVFVQGQRYHRLLEITDPQVGRETIAALKAVLTFAEGWLPSKVQKSPQPTLTASSVEQATFLARLRKQATPPIPGSLTLVDEIDDLVQQRLQERLDLAERRIRLTTSEDGGLCIHVGQQTFNAVNDIPDPQVQALIHDAIREWESS